MANLDDETICVIPYKDREYPFHPRDITVSRLITWGGKYGKEYGAYASFTGLFFQGDARAVTCVVSMLLKIHDNEDRPPEMIEFSPYDIYKAINDANEEKEKRQRDAAVDGDNPPPPPPSGVEMIHDGDDKPASS